MQGPPHLGEFSLPDWLIKLTYLCATKSVPQLFRFIALPILHLHSNIKMAAIVERGYNTSGFKVLSKDGQELDEEYLKRYKCVICNFLLREASQLLCGDRICKPCFPSR